MLKSVNKSDNLSDNIDVRGRAVSIKEVDEVNRRTIILISFCKKTLRTASGKSTKGEAKNYDGTD